MDNLINQFLNMSNKDLWLAFAAVAIPFVVATITKSNWSPLVKFFTMVATCIAASLGFIWAYDAFNTNDLPRLFLLMAVVSIAVYKVFHKPISQLEGLTDDLFK